ncbi:hypothetical protein KBK19_13965 [Microvirga sp. STR05]|uniref:Uncharacterized protein n=1 Tax=Hymenobacter duratus TaxID=2771356 RepID=A0ABR8JN05_9BACT|nr:hypothetical protein [Hymenobacter duratus]MBD2716144.1 hypothetical protein [Hymenobacter duratus]MBR7951058.1 hypothetical protein [Microvirga sp. STR05]
MRKPQVCLVAGSMHGQRRGIVNFLQLGFGVLSASFYRAGLPRRCP